MEGKAPDSSPRRQQQQQQQAPGSASNLDSFFKRLGQGQSSRLWAGPGRSGAAVPGSLRTHLHSKNDAGDSSRSSNSKLSPAVAAAGAAAAVAAASSPRRGKGGVAAAAAAADERYGSGASGGGTAANRFNNSNRVLSSSVGGDAGTAGAGAAGAAAAAAAAGLSAGNDRRRRNRTADDLSPSLLGTGGGGMWNEMDSGGGGGGGGSRNRAGTEGVPGSRSSNHPRAGSIGAASTTFGSGSGRRGSGSGGNGVAFGNSHVGDDPMCAPPSPSPVPPPPPSAAPAPVPPPPTQSPETPSAAAAAKPPAKPAARPALKQPAKQPAEGEGERGGSGAAARAGAGVGEGLGLGGEGAEAGAKAPTPAPALVARPSYRDKRFDEVLGEEVVKLDELRKISWNGVPPVHRAAVWQLLVGYMPANRVRRAAALERKRREYREAVPQYFDVPDASRTHQEQNILRQILVDVPRTCPDVPFFHQEKVQRAIERILYIWAIRHPASGYVQGINDLLTPLYVVFLSAHVGPSVESKDVSRVDESLLDEVEADVYWCLTKLLDNIQDHYTAMQPGLQRMVLRLEELVQRIDADLHRHITEEGLMYIQFAFRWMNCLLLRELPQRAVVRAWDTYLAEENGFESFHVYVSAALLCHFSSTLREMDFQTMVMFLQDMPTKEWGEAEVEPLLSQAYILSTLFERSPNHLGAS